MSRTLRIPVPCHPALLHEVLNAVGRSVTTVRAIWAQSGEPVERWAVILLDPSVDLAKNKAAIQTVLRAQLIDPAVKGKRPSLARVVDQEAALSRLEII
jgi:hypothetical protein